MRDPNRGDGNGRRSRSTDSPLIISSSSAFYPFVLGNDITIKRGPFIDAQFHHSSLKRIHFMGKLYKAESLAPVYFGNVTFFREGQVNL